MVVVVPHVELPPDQVRHPPSAPCFIGEAVLQSTLPQEGAKVLKLGGRESGGASGRHRRLESASTLQLFLPVADGVHGDAEVLGDLLV